MGMFDYLHVLDPQAASSFACAAGHPQQRFQTKGLGKTLTTYQLKDGRLYELGDAGSEETESRVDGEKLIVTIHTVKTGTRKPHSGTVVIYRNCKQCPEVVYVARGSWRGGDEVTGQAPWVEYKLKFVDGVLIKHAVRSLERREDIIGRLRDRGLRVLEDDDILARRFRGELTDEELDDSW